jgi:hypothetical protein
MFDPRKYYIKSAGSLLKYSVTRLYHMSGGFTMREALGKLFLSIAVLVILAAIAAVFMGSFAMNSKPFWAAVLLHAIFAYSAMHMWYGGSGKSEDAKSEDAKSESGGGGGDRK